MCQHRWCPEVGGLSRVEGGEDSICDCFEDSNLIEERLVVFIVGPVMLSHGEELGHSLMGGNKDELGGLEAGNGGTDFIKEPQAVAVAPLGEIGCRCADVELHGVVALSEDY